MTNEKAIKILSAMRKDWDTNSKCPNAHALDKAIEALKNEGKTEEKTMTCLDCRFHMFSDMYLECCKHPRIDNNEICIDFERLKGEKK